MPQLDKRVLQNLSANKPDPALPLQGRGREKAGSWHTQPSASRKVSSALPISTSCRSRGGEAVPGPQAEMKHSAELHAEARRQEVKLALT